MTTPNLSVIVPAYNESLRLPKTLETLVQYLDQHFARAYEILVVDDGSTDTTAQVVQQFQKQLAIPEVLQLISNGANYGKGYTIRHGFQKAQGERILFSDADLSTPINELEKMIPVLKTADIVIASRNLKDSDIQIKQPFARSLMGKTFGLLMRTIVLPGIQDSQCGFKLFKKEAVQWLLQQNLYVNGFAFDVEFLYLARKGGLVIQEVPVRWLNAKGTKVNPISDPLKMFAHLFGIRMRHRSVSPYQPTKQEGFA